MNCNELREHYELYAIGVADEPERTEIRAHLERHCEVRGPGKTAAFLSQRRQLRGIAPNQ